MKPLTLEYAIEKYKLDRRKKWFAYCGNVVYNFKYTQPCSGCSEQKEYSANTEIGGGCHECGYTGKRRSSCPVPAMDGDKPILIIDKDFTRSNKLNKQLTEPEQHTVVGC